MSETNSRAEAAGLNPVFSVVVPVYNEHDNVAELLREIIDVTGVKGEVIFVDDASQDGTVQALLAAKIATGSEGLRVIRHHSNFGQSSAVFTGIKAARSEWVMTLDGDGQNDPADMPKLLNALIQSEGRDDLRMICGQRVKRNDTWVRRLSSRVANGMKAMILGDDTPDTGCGLKLIHRESFLQLPFFDHMHRFLPVLMHRQGFASVSVGVNHRPRLKGHSKYGINNRLWPGLIDLAGVYWLKARSKQLSSEEET